MTRQALLAAGSMMAAALMLTACGGGSSTATGASITATVTPTPPPTPAPTPTPTPTPITSASIAEFTTLDLSALANYANPALPPYYDGSVPDNTPPGNAVTDRIATLGRVLFYDKRLSINNSIACASCHR